MELGPKDHHYYGLGEPNSIIVVYMEPLGSITLKGLCGGLD